jgi:hypothetical protein
MDKGVVKGSFKDVPISNVDLGDSWVDCFPMVECDFFTRAVFFDKGPRSTRSLGKNWVVVPDGVVYDEGGVRFFGKDLFWFVAVRELFDF